MTGLVIRPMFARRAYAPAVRKKSPSYVRPTSCDAASEIRPTALLESGPSRPELPRPMCAALSMERTMVNRRQFLSATIAGAATVARLPYAFAAQATRYDLVI